MNKSPKVTLIHPYSARRTLFELTEWRGDQAYVTNVDGAEYLINLRTGVAKGIGESRGWTMLVVENSLQRLRKMRARSGSRVVFDRTYHGFEDFADYFRDVHEAVDPDLNPRMKGIPGEFQGRIRVTVTYEGEG